MKSIIQLDPARIHMLRRRCGLTQQALADATLGDTGNKARSVLRRIQQWERTGRVWTRYAPRLAEALGVALDELQLDTEPMKIAGPWLAWAGANEQIDGRVLPDLEQALTELVARLPDDAGTADGCALRLQFAHGTYHLQIADKSGKYDTVLCFCRIRWVVERGLLWRRTSRIDRQIIERHAVDYLAEGSRQLILDA